MLALLKYILSLLLIVCLHTATGQTANETTVTMSKRKTGNPLEHLPSNIELLTHFGERADISPDNKSIAFMAKTFGDAMLIDLQTRFISCITCGVPGAAFLRVMHLSNGDYLLVGPEHFESPQRSRNESELWYLNKAKGSKPMKLGIKTSEGVAISKRQLKIAYNQPGTEAGITSQIIVAELDLNSPLPKVINPKMVLQSRDKSCRLEAQDFFVEDKGLIYFCYVANGAFEVMGLNLETGVTTNFSQRPDYFNEPEGIFPDGQYTAVESDWQSTWLGGTKGSANIDIWKLKLDGTGKEFTRLTHFNDFEGTKAANPVVSSDGRFMAFQAAKSSDPPGSGSGILIYWFNK